MSRMKEAYYEAISESHIENLANLLDNEKEYVSYLDSRIEELANEYQYMIATDHHKDRDCHWQIIRNWSYGIDEKWCVNHYGYVFRQVELYADTYEEAQEMLIELLEEAIESYKELKHD